MRFSTISAIFNPLQHINDERHHFTWSPIVNPWGQVTHICPIKLYHHWFRYWLVASVHAQPLFKPMMTIRPLGTNFKSIWIKLWWFSLRKVHSKLLLTNAFHFPQPQRVKVLTYHEATFHKSCMNMNALISIKMQNFTISSCIRINALIINPLYSSKATIEFVLKMGEANLRWCARS